MQDYNRLSKPVSRAIGNIPKASRQGSAADILQNYRSRAARYTPAESVISPPVQTLKKSGNGLPEPLRNGIENLSGYSMEHVNVHYNSSRPAQLQAHAYAQGSDIYIAPGEQQYLPHEAWHVVQQMQGRVRPDIQLSGMHVNLDEGLEREADVMGARSLQNQPESLHSPAPVKISGPGVIQGGLKDWVKFGAKALPHLILGAVQFVPVASMVSGLIDVVNSGIGMAKEIRHRKKFFRGSEIRLPAACSGVIDKPEKFGEDEDEDDNHIRGACNISIDIPGGEGIEMHGGEIRNETWGEKTDRVAEPAFTAFGGLLGAGGALWETIKPTACVPDAKPDAKSIGKDQLSIHSSAGYIAGNIGKLLDLFLQCCNCECLPEEWQDIPEEDEMDSDTADGPGNSDREQRRGDDLPGPVPGAPILSQPPMPQGLPMPGSGPQTLADQVMPDGDRAGMDDQSDPFFLFSDDPPFQTEEDNVY